MTGRHLVIRALPLAALCTAGAAERSVAQVTANPNVPQRAVLIEAGLRDASELGTLWTVSAGAQQEVARAVSAGVVVSYAWVDDTLCPADGGGCIESPTVIAFDAQLEFRYGQGAIHPYGVVALGAARLHTEGNDRSRWGFAYSPGLGLRGRAGARWWLFAEGRWRQERFGSIRADGVAGTVGMNIGF